MAVLAMMPHYDQICHQWGSAAQDIDHGANDRRFKGLTRATPLQVTNLKDLARGLRGR